VLVGQSGANAPVRITFTHTWCCAGYSRPIADQTRVKQRSTLSSLGSGRRAAKGMGKQAPCRPLLERLQAL